MCACLVQASLFFILPSLGTSVFLSPDETSNAVAARVFAQRGAMRIEDAILKDGPWLHPRSFVTHGTAMVPVGFLGLPIALGSIWILFGEWGMALAVPLLALSAAYPLWRFTRRFGRIPQIVTVMTWLSFPTVMLYANRGFFPNLPVVCLTLWAAFFVWSARSNKHLAIGGLVFGLAIAMRPVEIVWMLPWLWLAWSSREDRHIVDRKALISLAIAAMLPLLVAGIVAWRTYGSLFSIGYALRDPIHLISSTVEQAKTISVASSLRWPFGFHPNNVRFNVQSYLGGMWGPWMLVAAGTFALSLFQRARRSISLVALWTLGASALIYGHVIYQDHVGINVVSIGNSFPRYLLPLTPIFALAAGGFSAHLFQALSPIRARCASIFLLFALVLLGTMSALGSGDESILSAAHELERYRAIRHAAMQRFGTQAIILSERSDKIFFPVFRVASPVPPMRHIRELVENAPVPITLFSTTLDARGMIPWHDAGIDLQPAFVYRHQTLYVLTSASAARLP